MYTRTYVVYMSSAINRLLNIYCLIFIYITYSLFQYITGYYYSYVCIAY